jgi:hypothetical protein
MLPQEKAARVKGRYVKELKCLLFAYKHRILESFF